MQDKIIFEKDIETIDEVEIKPTGWYPITIEHGITQFGQSYNWQMCWRVKGTQHIFTIGLNEFYEHAQESYESHFEKILGIFRLDYLDWYKKGFPEPWMQKYRSQFKNYIYTFE